MANVGTRCNDTATNIGKLAKCGQKQATQHTTEGINCVQHQHKQNMYMIGVIKVLILGNCDTSVREKDWRCRKRGTQAT